MTDKIKILFLAANPTNVKYRLALDEEFNAIDKKLREGEFRDSFELVPAWNVKPGELQGILQRHKPHILHFSGHGTKSKAKGIVLEDEKRNMFLLDKGALAKLLTILKDNIRIVVLNACYSESQGKLLQGVVDFTIGMNRAIGDEAAIVFASHFYQGLAFGRSVETAFELGKGQLDLSNIPESKTPKLLVRYGVDRTKPVLPSVAVQRNSTTRAEDERRSEKGERTVEKTLNQTFKRTKIRGGVKTNF